MCAHAYTNTHMCTHSKHKRRACIAERSAAELGACMLAVVARTHARTHAHTHTLDTKHLTRNHIPTRTHTRLLQPTTSAHVVHVPYTCPLACACSSCANAQTHAHSRARPHTRTHAHTQNTHARTYACTCKQHAHPHTSHTRVLLVRLAPHVRFLFLLLG